ncbi:hypothetical protein Hanom_Chr09g00807801 [Helianthus anomalus]
MLINRLTTQTEKSQQVQDQFGMLRHWHGTRTGTNTMYCLEYQKSKDTTCVLNRSKPVEVNTERPVPMIPVPMLESFKRIL